MTIVTKVRDVAGADVGYTAGSRSMPYGTGRPKTLAEWTVANDVRDEHGAVEAFRRQIGPRWSGFHALDGFHQVVANVAALHILGEDWTVYAATVNRAVAGWRPGQGIILKVGLGPEMDERVGKGVEEVAKGHRYVSTVILDLVWRARMENGSMPSSAFVWLKRHDPFLWLLVHSVGRMSLLPETAAAVSHWRDEKAMRRALDDVHLDLLVDGVMRGLRA